MMVFHQALRREAGVFCHWTLRFPVSGAVRAPVLCDALSSFVAQNRRFGPGDRLRVTPLAFRCGNAI
jgi:hypothetical protein